MKRFRWFAALLALLVLASGLGACAEGQELEDGAAQPPLDMDLPMEPALLEDSGEGQSAYGADTLAPLTASEPAELDPSANAERELYVVLVDCGLALYGRSGFETSVVSAGGDPDGTLLSLIACAPGKLLGDADITVLGYHSELIGSVTPVSVSDEAQVQAQVNALRDLDEGQRKSSNLVAALDSLQPMLAAQKSAAAPYGGVHLVILSGGTLNFSGQMVNTARDLPARLSAVRELGVAIHAFGYDIATAPTLRTSRREDIASLMLTDALFEPGEYVAVSMAGSTELAPLYYGASVIDALAAAGGYEPSFMVSDSAQPQDGDVVIIWNNNEKTYSAYDYYSYVMALRSGAFGLREGLSARCCRPHEEPVPKQPEPADITSQLDKNNDGLLDAAAKGLSAGDEPLTVKCEALDVETYRVESSDPAVLAVEAEPGLMTLTPLSAGRADVTVSVEAGEAEPIGLSVTVRDFRLYWEIEDDEELTLDEETPLVSAFEPMEYTLEGLINGEWEVLREGNGRVEAVLSQDGVLSATVRSEGQYRVTAWITGEGAGSSEAARSFRTEQQLADLAGTELLYPYFKEQPGQRVAVMKIDGTPARLEGYALEVTPAELADVYEGPEGYYLVPKKAGEGTLTLKDAEGAEKLSAPLRVRSVTGQPLFIALAAVAGVCLLGLIAMLGVLIAKLIKR